MFHSLVGSVDANAAVVLVAFFAATCIFLCTLVVTFVVKRRSNKMIDNEFELAKIKQADETAIKKYQWETERGYKFKQLEQGLITSHKDNG